jgi:hypothetical protein
MRILPLDTLPVYQPGLQLLLTCRQVHSEVASVFYSSNTFVIARTQVPEHTRDDIHCNYAGRMLESWLNSLGTIISLLSKCHVDLDCIRRVKCSPREIDLPLFHLSHPSFRSRISGRMTRSLFGF